MTQNSIKMTLKEYSLSEMLSFFDPSVQPKIESLWRDSGTDGLVLFENLQMDSSCFGERSAVCFGPNRTFRSLEDAADRRLYDVPSRFQYPVGYATKNDRRKV